MEGPREGGKMNNTHMKKKQTWSKDRQADMQKLWRANENRGIDENKDDYEEEVRQDSDSVITESGISTGDSL